MSSLSRSLSGSVPRSESIARLASPVPNRAPSPLSLSDRIADSATPLAGAPAPGAKPVGPGTSALAAALSSSLGTSLPNHGTPPLRQASPAAQAASTTTGIATTAPTAAAAPPLGTTPPPPPPPAFTYGSFESRSRSGFENAEIVKRHLVVQSVNAAGRSEDSSVDGAPPAKGKGPEGAAAADSDSDEFSSLMLQGGDMTRGIYRWTEEAQKAPRRNSFSLVRPEPENETLDITSIKTPGGFRRNYIRRAHGSSSPAADPSGGSAESTGGEPPKLPTSSFLEFLTLYGHFAGEDLEEDDEALGPNEYFFDADYDSDESSGADERDREPMEDSALLTPSRRRRKRKPRGGSGTSSPRNALLLLLKSFVGTGVLFLPRAYLSGGILFGSLVLLAVALLSYYSCLLLVSVRLRIVGSYGDLGGILYGPWMRFLILGSIVLGQIGFVAAYTMFTAESMRAFVLAVTHCRTVVSMELLIIVQGIAFLPFSLLRDIGKLGFTALIADAFILIGLAYLLYYDVFTLSTSGIADILYFNRNDWPLFIGTALFTFEGIGLVLPIQEAMRQPQKFPGVLFAVMVIITVLYVTIGAVSYAAYGSATETVVLLSLPQDDKLVNAVQLLYSAAIFLSTPLQIFPAIKITENALFARSGKYNPYIKWQKNVYRFFIVALCMLIAWGGADKLDKFVALVGNFACIPMVFIYPPMLHYRAVAATPFRKACDIALTVFGFVAMAYTTTLTVISWAATPAEPLPGFCDNSGN